MHGDWLVAQPFDLIGVGRKLVIHGASSGRERGKKSTYVVKNGDTLFKIALRSGVSVADIKAWNRLSSDFIKVGQRLDIYK